MAPGDSEPLPLIRALLSVLRERRIRYCHWKSTPSLGLALQGRTDLDLLVDRRCAGLFAVAIRELGFKPFISSEARRYPGVEDYLGYDVASERLVHLHVYYQLVLGEEHIKNHRLPLENAFLGQALEQDGIMIPPPALELMVLGLRTLLKYRDTDLVKDAFGAGRRGGIPPDTLRELVVLRERATDEELRIAMRGHLPSVDADLLPELLAVVAAKPRDAAALRNLRSRARRGLRPYERLPRRQVAWRYARARLARQWPLRVLIRGTTRSELRRKAPMGGGITIAVIGADGAGKSTVIAAMHEWLAWRVNLRIAYLGSAQPSRLTSLTRSASRHSRTLARRAQRVGRAQAAADRLTAERYLADARDRATRVRDGRSIASRGAVVIFDRFPLPDVHVGNRIMDGPRIPTIPDWDSSARLRSMADREREIYADIPPPDHIIWLSVDPDVALARKPNGNPASVVAKIKALERADLSKVAPVTRIDAGAPLDEVLAAVKRTVWDLL